MIREIIILSILGVLVICAFFWTRRDAKKEKLAFLGFTVLLFTIIYCVSILGYKIGGPVDISKVEKAKKEVYAAKEDILEMTKDIIKIAYILADGAGRWNGMPKEHLEEINKIKNQLFKKLSIPIKEVDKIEIEAKKKREEINKKIEKSTKSQ